MGQNLSLRCSDEFAENVELASEALGYDNKSELFRDQIRRIIIRRSSTILGYHDDVDRLTWSSSEE